MKYIAQTIVLLYSRSTVYLPYRIICVCCGVTREGNAQELGYTCDVCILVCSVRAGGGSHHPKLLCF